MKGLRFQVSGFMCMALTSCAPFQMAGTNENGPYVVQSGGFAHKMKGGVLRAQHGQIILEQVLDEPDGVAAIDSVGGTLGWLATIKGFFRSDRIVKTGEAEALVKGTEDKTALGLKKLETEAAKTAGEQANEALEIAGKQGS